MNKLLALFEHSSDAAFAVDESQRIIFWNQTAEAVTGYSAAGAIGQPCWKLLKGATKDSVPLCRINCPIVMQIKAGKPIYNMDMAIRGQSGMAIPVNFSTIPVGPEGWNGEKPLLIHLVRPLEKPDAQFGTFRLYLLGPLRVQRLDGSFVNSAYWQDAEVRALLVLLARAAGVPLHKSELAAMLWPNLPTSITHGALETAVHHLRLCLEPDLKAAQDSYYILYNDDSYQFNDAVPTWFDLDHATAQLESARLEPNPHRAKQILSDTLHLFRGDYLADLSKTAVWTPDQHLHVQQLQIHALETMGDLQQQLGQPQEAKKHYLSALMINPDCDTAYQKLIHLAMPHSSKIEALQYCQRLATAIRSELDIILDEEFRELLKET